MAVKSRRSGNASNDEQNIDKIKNNMIPDHSEDPDSGIGSMSDSSSSAEHECSSSKLSQPDDRSEPSYRSSTTNYLRPAPVRDMDSTSRNSDYMFYNNPPTMYGYGSTQTSADEGYVSARSSELSSSSSSRRSATRPHAPAATPEPRTDRYFQGTALEYINTCIATIQDYKSIDPIKDVKETLGPELLEEMRQLLWGQEEDDEEKEFEALNAARDGDERIVALSLYVAKNHKQLNTMNYERLTVLHLAAQTCSAHLCRLLITRGADGAIADVWGDTALHIAARYGRADVIKALTTTLTKSEVYHPYFRVPYKSLPQDNVQSYNHDGRTPVHLAAQKPFSADHREALKSLVKHARADIDYQRLGDGYAPSHIAIDNDDIDCLEVCLRLGADSEVRNYKSETPQQLAFLHCDEDREAKMVKMCQRFGAAYYQLEYAKTESVEEEMDVDEMPMDASNHLTQKMEKMNFECD